MGFKDDFDALWDTQTDKQKAVSIRSQGESIYNQVTELITEISDSSGIDVNQDIKDVFTDFRTMLIECRTRFQIFDTAHPEFRNWRP